MIIYGMMIKFFFKYGFCCVILMAMLVVANAQNNTKMTIEQYIAKYKDIAIADMKEYRIPASITLAQGIIESSWGNSDLAVIANNHFGIKCHDDWKGDTFLKDDDKKDDCFRKYNNSDESFKDHSLFLTTRSRYAFLFELDITDYKGWAEGLKKAGYATNPKYPELLINLIEKYALNQYESAQPAIALVKNKDPKPVKVKDKVVTQEASGKRTILLNNRVKFIIARKNDTFLGLAAELGMGAWQFYRYNDMNKNDHIKEGQIVYLQPKRRRSSEFKQHLVKEGETLYNISQKYAVKTKHLQRLNPELSPDGDLNPGQIILLQKQGKGAKSLFKN